MALRWRKPSGVETQAKERRRTESWRESRTLTICPEPLSSLRSEAQSTPLTSSSRGLVNPPPL